MILLSPPKLLMILAIALIVLGPDKLPSAARRVGALWHEFTRWRAHLEREVRATFPDLPSTTEIARAVRSPISVLDRLADDHGSTGIDVAPGPVTDDASAVSATAAIPPPRVGAPSSGPSRPRPGGARDFVVEHDVSSLN